MGCGLYRHEWTRLIETTKTVTVQLIPTIYWTEAVLNGFQMMFSVQNVTKMADPKNMFPPTFAIIYNHPFPTHEKAQFRGINVCVTESDFRVEEAELTTLHRGLNVGCVPTALSPSRTATRFTNKHFRFSKRCLLVQQHCRRQAPSFCKINYAVVSCCLLLLLTLLKKPQKRKRLQFDRVIVVADVVVVIIIICICCCCGWIYCCCGCCCHCY